jgi:sporulation protein YlmC with PRC-barrel domain
LGDQPNSILKSKEETDMDKIKIVLLGMLVMVAFAVAPVYAAEEGTDTQQGAGEGYGQDQEFGQQMGEQEGSIRASELMDKSVKDQQGNEIGSVEDLIVSQEGEVEFLILSEGAEFLGIGEEEFIPIPWDQVDAQGYSPDQDELTVNVDEQTLREAPTFTDDEWQTFTQGDMDQEVRGYYGQEQDPAMEDDEWEMDEDQDQDDEWGDDDTHQREMEQQPGQQDQY